MKVKLPEKEKVSKKRISIYIAAIIICIFAIIIVVGVQVLGDDIINNLFGINVLVKRTEQEEALLKSNFENIFNNKINISEEYNSQKIDNDLEIVHTSYSKQHKTEKHDINVNIPFVNIKNTDIEDFNKEIKNTFQAKSEEILNNENENIIYTVKYKANIENNILSLIIYSDLKRDTSAQRVIIQTLNYDLEKNKIISLEEIINKYDLNKKDIQNKIDKNINEEYTKSEELKELGYNVFSRDIENDIYELENIREFFINENNIYIIFAYGNENITSEMDIVII